MRLSFGNGEDILVVEDWVFGSEIATVTLYIYVILTMVIHPIRVRFRCAFSRVL